MEMKKMFVNVTDLKAGQVAIVAVGGSPF